MIILIFLVTILILVLVHEFGHFFAAKKSNVRVLEFGFGIPPRIFGKKFGETVFSLNWLPIGGFVKLLGEDEDDPKALNDRRSFATQNVWKRILIVVAGVSMNLILAWVLFYIILFSRGFQAKIPLLLEHKFIGAVQTEENIVLIGEVSDDSPAKASGLKEGERVLALNDEFIDGSKDLIDKVKLNAGKEIKLTLSDVEKKDFREIKLIPRENPPENQGALGVRLASFKIANLEYKSLIQKVFSGLVHSYNLTDYSIKILSSTISQAFRTKDFAPISGTVAGPVGITSLIGDILNIRDPFIPYLEFLSLLSLNLAIINILPFPGLDGGRLVFLLYEALFKKKVSPKIEKYIHSVGLAILIGLILLVTMSDIRKLL